MRSFAIQPPEKECSARGYLKQKISEPMTHSRIWLLLRGLELMVGTIFLTRYLCGIDEGPLGLGLTLPVLLLIVAAISLLYKSSYEE